MARLLDRIKERVAKLTNGKPKKMTAAALPPPATSAEIALVESRLGFKLPNLLKALYGEVANGGFGPAEGFLGVPRRMAAAGIDLLKAYRTCSRRGQDWPTHLLPVVYGGGSIFFCIDCDHRKNRVIVFDSDLGGLDESDFSEPRSRWPYPNGPLATCFRTRAKSLEEFLEMWLADETQLYRWV